MRVLFALSLVAAVAASGCSRLGSLTAPFGSVGSLGSGSIGSGSLGGGARQSGPVTREGLPDLVPAGAQQVVQDRRGQAQRILSAELTPVAAGRVLRVTVQPPTAGAYNAELVELSRDGGTVTYVVRLAGQAGTSREPSQVVVARKLTQDDLAGVRRIVVQAAEGSRSFRL